MLPDMRNITYQGAGDESCTDQWGAVDRLTVGPSQFLSHAAGQEGRTESWSLEAARQFFGPLADALALGLQFSGAKAQRMPGWKP